MEYQFKVGHNSVAVVEPDFSVDDQMGLNISLGLNAYDPDSADQDSPEDADNLLEEAAQIFIEALRNLAIDQGIEVTDTDFTPVEQ